jgi:class 3 adenylate cyclase
VPKLTAAQRAKLPDSAFAYIDSAGRRRLPIHDEAHVRNALARFDRVRFQDDAARERARRRLLNAAKKHGIVPVGFITGQLRTERSNAAEGRVRRLPGGTVTFLLSDIEGSTALLERLGNRYGALLEDVRAIVREAVLEAGGVEVDARADEFFAVFERPAPAVLSAVSVQRALAERRWPGRVECRLRIGIHTGRPTVTGSGYVGLSVHTAARICFAANGGQILVSGETRAALERRMPTGVSLAALGRHRLPGLGRTQALFQVGSDGLSGDFPPLRLRA